MQKLSIADELRAAKADVGKAHLQLADEKRAASHAVSLEMVKFRSAEQDAETRIIQAESQAQSKIVGEEQRVSRELARSRVVIAEEQTKVKNGTQLLEVKEESLKALRDDLTARDAEARAIQVSLDEQQLVVQKQSCSIAKTEAQMQSIHDDQKRKAELLDKTQEDLNKKEVELISASQRCDDYSLTLSAREDQILSFKAVVDGKGLASLETEKAKNKAFENRQEVLDANHAAEVKALQEEKEEAFSRLEQLKAEIDSLDEDQLDADNEKIEELETLVTRLKTENDALKRVERHDIHSDRADQEDQHGEDDDATPG